MPRILTTVINILLALTFTMYLFTALNNERGKEMEVARKVKNHNQKRKQRSLFSNTIKCAYLAVVFDKCANSFQQAQPIAIR